MAPNLLSNRLGENGSICNFDKLAKGLVNLAMKNEQTILIIDDEERNIRLLKAMLVQENYRIIFALNGEDALAIVNSMNLDLILLDVMMLGMDGFKVCRKIKDDEKTMNIPIIMVTVLTGKENQMRAFKAGADDYMSKPVRKSELLARVNSALRSHEYEGRTGRT